MNEDQVKGKVRKVKGKAKKVIGHAIGDTQLEAEGKAEVVADGS